MSLVLQCRPGKSEQRLTFHYTVENQGAECLWIMEALALADPDAAGLVVACGEAEVLIGKLPPPMPKERRMAVVAVPLARCLKPGETRPGSLAVRLPLAEQSAYFQELRLRDYSAVELRAVRFAVGYWLAGPTVAAVPAEDGLVRMVAPDLAGVRHATQTFPVKSLTLFRRNDGFPRDVGSAPVSP